MLIGRGLMERMDEPQSPSKELHKLLKACEKNDRVDMFSWKVAKKLVEMINSMDDIDTVVAGYDITEIVNFNNGDYSPYGFTVEVYKYNCTTPHEALLRGIHDNHIKAVQQAKKYRAIHWINANIDKVKRGMPKMKNPNKTVRHLA
jgi:hypothetical protein